jgi:uncharacterized protein
MIKLFDKFTSAAGKGNIEIVIELMNNGVNIDCFDSYGETALHYASQYGHLSIVDFLVKAGANLEIKSLTSGLTPLILAASDLASARRNEFEKNVIKVIYFLVEVGADPNAVSDDGWTALIGAVNAGSLEAVQVLLTAGADVKVKNEQGDTALSIARESDNDEIIKTLLDAGAIE